MSRRALRSSPALLRGTLLALPARFPLRRRGALVVAVVLSVATPAAAQDKTALFTLAKDLWLKQQMLNAAQNFQMPSFQMPQWQMPNLAAAAPFAKYMGRKLLMA